MSSEHEVRVVRLGDIRKHENADTLGITEVDGRPCIVRLGEYALGDLAIYVPIDSLCPTSDPRFAFLLNGGHKADAQGRCRIKALRLRETFSMGLLVKPDAGMVEGEEVRERLGIGIWEPTIELKGTDAESDPGFLIYYDIESARKYHRLLVPGEEVVVTEKVNGENSRYAFHQGRLWVSSHTTFKKRDPNNQWWWVAERIGLEVLLARHPGIAIYGELYGKVGGFKYGLVNPSLILFDALDIEARRWLDYDEFLALAADLGQPVVPQLFRGSWSDLEMLKPLAEGQSILAAQHGCTHLREGWVLRPTTERWDDHLGRVIMKLVGEGYLTRKGG